MWVKRKYQVSYKNTDSQATKSEQSSLEQSLLSAQSISSLCNLFHTVLPAELNLGSEEPSSTQTE